MAKVEFEWGEFRVTIEGPEGTLPGDVDLWWHSGDHPNFEKIVETFGGPEAFEPVTPGSDSLRIKGEVDGVAFDGVLFPDDAPPAREVLRSVTLQKVRDAQLAASEPTNAGVGPSGQDS